MPRVVAGALGGRRFAAPPGGATRPTAERVREALFSALAVDLPGAVVVDLFAGSGALAIEALSRGAARAVLVESGRRAAAVIGRNLADLGLDDPPGRALVRGVDARAFCAAPEGGPFDVVLADPPYDLPAPALAGCVADLATAGALRPGARIVLERDRRGVEALEAARPAAVAPERVRAYGDTVLVWWRAGEEAPGDARGDLPT